MLFLPDVTLCCIDTANHALALRALRRSLEHARFARTLFVTDRSAKLPEIEVVAGVTIGNRDDYSRFVIRRLRDLVTTGHVLLIQWDGFVVNPDAWSESFLSYDYIGAKWHWHDDGMNVGNGGFSLRSRKLLEALADPEIVIEGNEDELICRRFRPLLEARYGIRFAPASIADRFSFEADYPAGTPFGFHGLFNFWRVVSADDLDALCGEMSDVIAASPQLEQLARNYLNLGRWREASLVLERILGTVPARADLEELLRTCRSNAERTPAARRNDPCPCGSGKRYKHCHGASPAGAGDASGAAARPAQVAARPAADDEVRQALALHQRGELDPAEAIYRRVLESADHPVAEHYLGVLHYQRRDFEHALPLLERSTARRPQEPDFHLNLGIALLAAGQEDRAIPELRQTLALAPRHASARNNLGLALQAVNRLEEAAAEFRAAIALQPSFAEAHWNLGLALLAAGAFEEGWEEYEWRLRISALGGAAPRSSLPSWDGSLRPGLRLLLQNEQGLGDAIQFARFVPILARRGLRVQLQCKPELRRLFGSLPGVDRLVDPGEEPAGFEAACPMLSVAHHLRVVATSIPDTVPYVSAAADDIDGWRARMRAHGGKLRVGIVWSGSRTHANDRNRSCPFERIASIAALPGIALISLQIGEMPAAFHALRAAGRVTSFASELSDLYDTAALIGALDVVVTVDTSVAHLAGALAKPVIVMLPFAPDWRWQLDRADSPWYPSATLVRPPRPRDWEAVVSTVGSMLTGPYAQRLRKT